MNLGAFLQKEYHANNELRTKPVQGIPRRKVVSFS